MIIVLFRSLLKNLNFTNIPFGLIGSMQLPLLYDACLGQLDADHVVLEILSLDSGGPIHAMGPLCLPCG